MEDEILNGYTAVPDNTAVSDEYGEPQEDIDINDILNLIGQFVPGYNSVYDLLNGKGIKEAMLDLQDDVVPFASLYRDWYENGNFPNKEDFVLAMLPIKKAGPKAKNLATILNAKAREQFEKGRYVTLRKKDELDPTMFSKNPAYPEVKATIDNNLASLKTKKYDDVDLEELIPENSNDVGFLRHHGTNYDEVAEELNRELHDLTDRRLNGFKYTRNPHPTKPNAYQLNYQVRDDFGKWHDVYDTDFRSGVLDFLEKKYPGSLKAANVSGVKNMLENVKPKSEYKPNENARTIRSVFDPKKFGR